VSGKAIVLLSGGMDSTTLAYVMAQAGYDVIGLSLRYNQRHVKEVACAAEIMRGLQGAHHVIDLSAWGRQMKSVLTSDVGAIPEGHYAADNMSQTVVPLRNPLFLTIATSIGSSLGAAVVAAAVHAGDHAVYPDCRPEFTEAFTAMAEVALDGMHKPRLRFPFVEKTKAEIVVMGHAAGVPWAETWSCYKGGAQHCGRCGTCVERAEAFAVAGVVDPTSYDDPTYWETVTDFWGDAE